MGYLNNAGLSRFWNAIKGMFVRTVNGVSPDANGNVQVSGGGSAIGNRGVFYGTCDTAAATTEKAVTCGDFTVNDLVAGSVVMVLFSVTNSGAVASLTLNVNSTGAKSIKYISNGSYANIPAAGYLKAGQIYQFTFDGTNWIVEMNCDTNNNAYRSYMADAKLTTYTNLYRYMLCFTKDEQTILPVNAVSNNTGTGKQLTTEAFDPFGPIWYYSSTTTVNAGSKAGSLYYFIPDMDLRYSFNTAKTLTASKNVYIVCIPYGDKVKLYHTNPISQALPSTDDGKLYILLGVAYDTYRVCVHTVHPIYYYKNGELRRWTNSGDIIEFGAAGDADTENQVLSHGGSWIPVGSKLIELTPTWSGNTGNGTLPQDVEWAYINEVINAKNNVTFLVNKGTDRLVFNAASYEPETESIAYEKDIYFRTIPDRNGYYELTRNPDYSNQYTINYVELGSENDDTPSTFIKKVGFGRVRIYLKNVDDISLGNGDTKIIVKRCVGRSRGLYSWKHFKDFSELNSASEIRFVDGYSQIIGIPHSCIYGTPSYPNPPSWMPVELFGENETAVYGLKTVFELNSQTVSYDDKEDLYYYNLDIGKWLLPMLKPAYAGGTSFDWASCGLIGVCNGRAPLLFKFEIEKLKNNSWKVLEGSSENTLAVGVRRVDRFGQLLKLYVYEETNPPGSYTIYSQNLYISIR